MRFFGFCYCCCCWRKKKTEIDLSFDRKKNLFSIVFVKFFIAVDFLFSTRKLKAFPRTLLSLVFRTLKLFNFSISCVPRAESSSQPTANEQLIANAMLIFKFRNVFHQKNSEKIQKKIHNSIAQDSRKSFNFYFFLFMFLLLLFSLIVSFFYYFSFSLLSERKFPAKFHPSPKAAKKFSLWSCVRLIQSQLQFHRKLKKFGD